MKDIIDVIVVGFERPKETFLTVEALLKANDNVRVILVHDGSIEKPNLDSLATDRIIQIDLPHCGQPKALNAGFELVKSEYVVIMHNDVVIKDIGWVRKAIDFLKMDKEAGLVCALGWNVFYKKDLPQHFFHSISSFKNYIHREEHTVLKEDFVEVWDTDNMVNVFKTGIKADERFRFIGAHFWIDIKAKGLKCYVMRFDDSIHLPSSSSHLERYKKMTTYKKEWDSMVKITCLRMKELGVQVPTREEVE